MTGRVVFLVVLAISSGSLADTVYLNNGDRLSGRLLSIDEGAVLIETPYAGRVCVETANISHVEAQSGAVLHLDDGRDLDSTLGPQAAAMAELSAVTAGEETPEPAPEENAGPWSGSVETGLAMRSGNTDTTDFSMSASIKRKAAWNTFTGAVSAGYGEADDILNTRRAAAEGKWQVYPRERLYLFGLAGLEHDDGRKLDLRANLGGGLGYDFIEEEKRARSADIGLDYTWERWDPFTPAGAVEAKNRIRDGVRAQFPGYVASLLTGPLTLDSASKGAGMLLSYIDPLRGAHPHTEDQLNLRFGAEYSQELFKASTLKETVTLFPNLNETGEYRMTSALTFSTPLRQNLKLNVNLKTEYDSRADDRGVESWDNALTTGLRYEF